MISGRDNFVNKHRHCNKWYSYATRSRLEPIKKVARILKWHLDNLLNYFGHQIINAGSEGMNSKFQTLKSNARGFRSFEGGGGAGPAYSSTAEALGMEPEPSH
ncbi:transposase [Microbulbifer halophilus]|uniref:Transposase n=1 Tax=Microbulbifer halophilus TaxID=453963 RepID=A0ABW5EDR5_9GAMM